MRILLIEDAEALAEAVAEHLEELELDVLAHRPEGAGDLRLGGLAPDLDVAVEKLPPRNEARGGDVGVGHRIAEDRLVNLLLKGKVRLPACLEDQLAVLQPVVAPGKL